MSSGTGVADIGTSGGKIFSWTNIGVGVADVEGGPWLSVSLSMDCERMNMEEMNYEIMT
jgi:hypothetical protein